MTTGMKQMWAGSLFVCLGLLGGSQAMAQSVEMDSPSIPAPDSMNAAFVQASADCNLALQKLRNGEELTDADRSRCGDAPELYFEAIKRSTGETMNYSFPEPERTQFYMLALKAAIVDWDRHGGWAFISTIRRRVRPQLKTLYAETPDPFKAFCLLFLALDNGDVVHAGQMLDTLVEQDDFLADMAVQWTFRAADNRYWFIDYYTNKEQPDRAESLIAPVLATGEQYGFEAKAHLLKRMGRYTEAEACYKEIETKNAYIGTLVDFYLKYRTRTDDLGVPFQQRYDEMIERCFPNGLQTVQLEDFSEPPQAGVVFIEDNPKTRRAGLPRGTVIVALDGIALDNLTQYFIIRQLQKSNPRMDLIVWSGTEYKKASISLNKRRFGLDLQNYPHEAAGAE